MLVCPYNLTLLELVTYNLTWLEIVTFWNYELVYAAMYGCIWLYGPCRPPPCGLCACCRCVFPWTNTSLDFPSMYFVGVVICLRCFDLLNTNMVEICSNDHAGKTRIEIMPRDVFVLKLISLVILGMIEPWPECEPDESRPREASREDSSIYIYIYIAIYTIYTSIHRSGSYYCLCIWQRDCSNSPWLLECSAPTICSSLFFWNRSMETFLCVQWNVSLDLCVTSQIYLVWENTYVNVYCLFAKIHHHEFVKRLTSFWERCLFPGELCFLLRFTLWK